MLLVLSGVGLGVVSLWAQTGSSPVPGTVPINVSPVVQSDLLIRSAGETAYSGDNLYNTSGDGQSRSQIKGNGATAVYDVRVQNDALVAGVVTVTGPRSRDGWTVRYFDTATGAEITDTVTGDNGLLFLRRPLLLTAGQTVTWRVEVTPGSSVAAGASFEVALRSSTIDNPTGIDLGADVVKATTIVNTPPVAKPDAYETNEDAQLNVRTGGVLFNDLDVDGDPLTAQLVSTTSHGTLALNTDGSFVYTPTRLFYGSDSFTYKAFDGQAVSSIATVTLSVTHVNHAPTAANQSLDLNEDGNITFDLSASDVDGDPLSYTLATQPAHGTLSGTSPHLTYTPSAHFYGSDSLTFTASDGKLSSNTASVAFSVHHVNHKPVGKADLYQTNQNAPVSVDAAHGVLANDTDPDGDTLTAILVSGPSHGTLTLGSTGSLSYTPAQNWNGTDSFSYHPEDNGTPILDGDPVTVTLVVNYLGPVAYDGSVTTDQDTPVTGQLRGDDANYAQSDLVFSLVSSPSAGTVQVNANGSFTYSPGARNSGLDTLTFQVKNPVGTVSKPATETIGINRATNPPTAVPDEYWTPQDKVLSGTTVLANDQNPAAYKMTAVQKGAPMHGALALNPGGTFSYTPNAGFVGDDNFLYLIRDARTPPGVSNTATVTIHVTHVNHAPVAQNDPYTTDEDTPLSLDAAHGVLANDTDVDGTTYGDALHVALVAGSGPSRGTLTLNGDGSLLYTPRPLHSTQNASDGFNYTVSDGRGGSAQAHVAITIQALNHAPVAPSQTLTTPQDTALAVTLSASDSDGEAVSLELVSQPMHGVLSGPVAGPIATGTLASGALTYTPSAGYRGPDAFNFLARDARGLSSGTASVSITVLSNNRAPRAVDDAYSTREGTPVTVAAPGVLGNDSDPDGDALSVTGVDVSQTQGTVTWNADGSFVYTPAARWFGVDGFDYTVSDGHGGTATAHVGVGVARVNHAPVAVDDAATVNGAAIDIGVLLNDSDADGDVLQVVDAGSPGKPLQSVQGASLSINSNGTVHYAPSSTVTGTDSFSYTVSDGDLAATAKVTITIQTPTPYSSACGLQTFKVADTSNGKKGILVFGPRARYSEVQYARDAASLVRPGTQHTVTVVDASTWAGMTTDQFKQYQAIIISESGDLSPVNANKAVWSPAIDGPIVAVGGDPAIHALSGYGYDPAANQLFLKRAFNFVATGNGTGLYIAFPNDYYSGGTGEVQVLSEIAKKVSPTSTFTVIPGNENDVSLVKNLFPAHLVMKGFPGEQNPPFSDAGAAQVDIRHSEFTKYPSSVFYSLIGQVNHYPGVVATDCQPSAPTPTAPPGPDTTKPRVSIQYPGDGDSVTGLDFVSGQASDDRGAVSVKMSIQRLADKLFWSDATMSWTTTATSLSTAQSGTSWSRFQSDTQIMPSGVQLQGGNYLLGATATDGAGNFATASATVRVDNTAPQIAITYPANGATLPAWNEVRGTASDDSGYGVRVWLQRQSDKAFWAPNVGWVANYYDGVAQVATLDVPGGTWRQTSGWPAGSDLSLGDYIVFAQATDAVGHQAQTQNAFRIGTVTPTPSPTATATPVPIVTATPAPAQPDGIVTPPNGTSVGDGVVNADGTDQIAATHVAPGGSVSYTLTLRNNSGDADSLILVGPASKNGWTLSYTAPDGKNISDAVTNGTGWMTPSLEGGASVDVTLRVTSPATGSSGLTCLARLYSARGDAFDTFGTQTIVDAALPAPGALDASIRAVAGDTSDKGVGVVNLDGAGQIAQNTGVAGAGNAAVYVLTLRNTSSAADTLVWRGPAHENGGTKWSLRYFDAPTGTNDITTQVTSQSGWSTPNPVAAGGSLQVRVEVSPDAALPAGNTFTALFGVQSARDTSAQDVVGAQTADSFFPSTPTPTPTTDPNKDDAAWVSGTVPTQMVVGHLYRASETFKNTGGTTWNLDGMSGTYALGSEEPTDNGTWGMKRVTSGGASCVPAQGVQLTWTVTAPQTPGTYAFAWRMNNGAAGKGRFGQESAIVQVVVSAEPTPTPGPVPTSAPTPTATPTNPNTQPNPTPNVEATQAPTPAPTPTAAPTATPAPSAAKVDALVLAPNDTGFVGDNFYTATGDGVQSIGADVPANAGANIGVAVENDGQTPAKMRFFGPVSSGGWILSYLAVSVDANGAVVTRNVTTQVTGAGFVTSSALRGPAAGTGGQRDVAQINVLVSSGNTVAVGATKTLAVHWEEDGVLSDVDAVTIKATKTAGTQATPGPTVVPTPTSGPTPTPGPSPTPRPTATPKPTPVPTATPVPRLKAAAPAIHPDQPVDPTHIYFAC